MSVRGPEHARTLANEEVGIGTVESYSSALLGITRDHDGDTLVFVIGDTNDEAWYGPAEAVGDLLEEVPEELQHYADQIDELAADSKGLIFDFNSIEPWSFFQDTGEIHHDRFQSVDDVIGFVDALKL